MLMAEDTHSATSSPQQQDVLPPSPDPTSAPALNNSPEASEFNITHTADQGDDEPHPTIKPDDGQNFVNTEEKILKLEPIPPLSNLGESGISYAFPPPVCKPVVPKYVVRPGPVPPAPKYVLTEFGTHHALDYTIWMHVFCFLNKDELAQCLRVCKTWNRWCLESRLWRTVDLSDRKIHQNHLIGLVRRQPRTLWLRDTVISRKQLAWLIVRLPHLKELDMYNNTWAAINAMCGSACPLLEKLDLSWCNGLWDDCIRDMVTPPSDHRPGVDESVSRLRRCTELSLVGTNITDNALDILATYLPCLSSLDISYCTDITRKGLELLSDDCAVTKNSLTRLNLICMNHLDDDCFLHLAEMPNLVAVDLSLSPKVSNQGCQKFIENAKHKNFVMLGDLKIGYLCNTVNNDDL